MREVCDRFAMLPVVNEVVLLLEIKHETVTPLYQHY